MQIEFRIPGLPVAQPRQRHRIATFGGRARAINYTPAKDPVNSFKASARLAAAMAYRGAPLDKAVAIEVVFVFARPKSVPKRDGTARLPHTSKPDLDNVMKALLDALNGVLFMDDSQVNIARIEKWKAATGEQPHTLVRVFSG
jgi:Holliday junction resolvase RusA-like endonuclease